MVFYLKMFTQLGQKHLFAEPGTQLWAPMRESSSTERWTFSGNSKSSVLTTGMRFDGKILQNG